MLTKMSFYLPLKACTASRSLALTIQQPTKTDQETLEMG